MSDPYADLQDQLDQHCYRSVVQSLYAGETRTLFAGRAPDVTQACWVTIVGGEWYVTAPDRRSWRIADRERAIACCLFLLQRAAQGKAAEPLEPDLDLRFGATPVSEAEWRAMHNVLRREMEGAAWRELPRVEEDAVWVEVESRLGELNDPATPEPRPSLTFSVAEFYRRPQYEQFLIATEFRAVVHRSLCEILAEGETALALDWNHPCYYFDPRQLESPRSARAWIVPPLPDRDPVKFVTADFRIAWLTYMDDRMIAIGQPLIDALMQSRPAILDTIIRVDGRPVR